MHGHDTAATRGTTRSTRPRTVWAPLLLVSLLLAGCSSADGDGGADAAAPAEQDAATSEDAATTDETTSSSDSEAGSEDDSEDDSTRTDTGGAQAIQFTTSETGYDGLPDVVGVGSTLAYLNQGGSEFHQIAVYRLADGDTRSVDELAALELDVAAPDAIGNGVLAGLDATPVGGLSAPPGAPGRAFAGPRGGATELALDEPGRYLVIGTLPVGTPVPTAIEAENSGDYSALQTGPFHYQQGEIAVIEVVA